MNMKKRTVKRKNTNPLSRRILAIFICILGLCIPCELEMVRYALIFGISYNIYYSLKEIHHRLKTRKKIGVSKVFLWEYFMYLNGCIVTCLTILLFVMTRYPEVLLLLLIGIGWIYGFGKQIMKDKEDLEKIERWKERWHSVLISSVLKTK
jgi:hypothetical protein